ncbi:Gfo/Idh/MocA family protein [Parasedimentitalea psychrophila]|uniref:Gfo/Idh/MocA family oxidoreductase n=1 Tax=Parasedimentitalea psychrophila TaxID=2997337 RepID=A0A9Y2KZ90_9RHOB|nr:Gfo/Idh/MocA family oxidoreductase [Parasedimentitalea psychrophila]WIY25179.1 Gfo/Idh/MocA family oxidoreductase [Parasedimentitalea psychrophila]
MHILGVGIIGCGNISTTYLNFAPKFCGLEVRAVADINMDTAISRAQEYNVRADTVEALLQADDIDIIVNLTIPAAHFEITRKILQAGKHAYSEKPFVLNLDDGKELRDLATAKGLRIGSAPDTFFGGSHQLARAAIDGGKIGTVIGGSCHVMSHGMEHWHPNPDFFFQPGGGPVLDLGPYYITNLIQLIGPVRAVTAMTGTSFPTRTISNGPRDGETVPVETPTNIHALLEFENGAIVTFGASWDVWNSAHPNMELYGTQGTISLPDPNFFGGEVTLATKGDDFAVLAASDHPFGVANEEDNDGRLQANYRAAGLAEMAQAISEDRLHRCNIDLALHAVDVMTAILAAGETRQWIEMTTSCARPAPLSPAAALSLLRDTQA